MKCSMFEHRLIPVVTAVVRLKKRHHSAMSGLSDSEGCSASVLECAGLVKSRLCKTSPSNRVEVASATGGPK